MNTADTGIVPTDAEAEHEPGDHQEDEVGAKAEANAPKIMIDRHGDVDLLAAETSAIRPKAKAPTKAPRMADPVTQLVCSVLRCHWVVTSAAAVPITKRS